MVMGAVAGFDDAADRVPAGDWDARLVMIVSLPEIIKASSSRLSMEVFWAHQYSQNNQSYSVG